MPPTGEEHGFVEFTVGSELRQFVRTHRLGRISGGEVGIYIARNPDTVRAADVLFISNERYARRKSTGYLDVAPELVVEILSPDDRWADLMLKLRQYFAAGVLMVWVIDPASQVVQVFRSPTHVRELRPGEELTGEDVLPGFTMPVAALFED